MIKKNCYGCGIGTTVVLVVVWCMVVTKLLVIWNLNATLVLGCDMQKLPSIFGSDPNLFASMAFVNLNAIFVHYD